MNGLIGEIINYLVPALGGGVTGWLFGRRRQEQEVKGLEIANVEKVAAMWREMAEEANVKLQQVYEQIQPLKEELSKLSLEHMALNREFRKMMKENNTLRQRIIKLEQENKTLRG